MLIFGDKGTDFATEFYMTFEKIIKHMQNDHKWTNKELLDAGYCEEVSMNIEMDSCIKRLTKWNALHEGYFLTDEVDATRKIAPSHKRSLWQTPRRAKSMKARVSDN